MDIDSDIEDAGRARVIDYVRFKYGKKKVANIITFGTCAAKNSVKTINRVLGYSVANGDKIAKLIPDKSGTKLKDALEEKDFRALYNTDKEAKNIIDLAMKIEGLKTSMSIHPCGVECVDKEITNYMPEVLMEDPETKEKVWVTQMEGPTCEELGCLKMDFLGLRTLGYVHETINSIKKNHNVDVNYDEIPLNDMKVYEYLAKGNTASIFQVESDMFTSVIKKTLKDYKTANGDECFNRLVAMNALVRPGSNVFIDDFADRILHPEHIEYLVPELKPILGETYGIILYQEQTMRITRDLAGFSMGQSDSVRKGMAKKKKYILDEYKDYFVHGNKKMKIKGCVANGIPEDKAIELWDVMAMAASYSFNKSHAVAYSMHSIRTAWLSYYYPYEYMTAVLNSYSTDVEKLGKYLNVARSKSMKISSPSINKSQELFTTDGNSIQIGFGGIKGINAVASDLIKERESGNFKDLKDLLDRMSYYKNFSKKTLESLILAGMLDDYCGTRENKYSQIETMVNYVKKLKDYRKKLTDGKKHRTLIEPVLELQTTISEMNKFDLLMFEKTYTGMYISGNPMDMFKTYTKGCLDCSNIKEGYRTVCGIVEEVEKKVSKKGNAFYTFKLENNGIISGLLFSKNGETIEEGDVVKLEGKVEINEYGTNIMVETKQNLKDIKTSIDSVRNIEIKIDNEEQKKIFKTINFPEGEQNITIFYNNKKAHIYKNIAITPQTAQEILDCVGEKNVRYRKDD